LRQSATALLAVPFIVAVHLVALLRRSVIARAGLAFGLSLVLGIGFIGTGRPAVTVATPPNPITPLAQVAFTTRFSTDRGLSDPVAISFTAPMDPASVAGAVSVEPSADVDLSWDASATVLTISPRPQWSAGVFYTVTVQAGALARSGQPLARPARAVFLTREATTGSIVATDPIGKQVSTDTAFLVSFAGPVDPATVHAGIRLDPPTPGVVRSNSPTEGPGRYTFTPSAPLRAGVAYRIIVSGVRDTDGLALQTMTLAVRTAKAPAVVRFRPRADTLAVPREAPISVRFTQPMEHRSTARAFRVSVDGTPIAGKIRWAERDTVLVFTPAVLLPYGTTVEMDVGAGATGIAGVPIAMPAHGTFQTIKTVTAYQTSAVPSSGGGGSAVGAGSWYAVETYFLGLMNCTRTGGWVTSTGACSSPGGRNVAELKLDSGISSAVSRPYAKKLALSGACSHFSGGNPGDRLRRAGYTGYHWAENLTCRSGEVWARALSGQLFFQSEKATGGGHYVNLMNAEYDRVGIGVWVYGARVRIVIDFYHP